ncbi:MAG: hypothetical protein MUF15_02465 [Acidobacteria bacterium]|jgi:hypothetical protein|nr:hypothetical protein [Acidobacteriota bacterium]
MKIRKHVWLMNLMFVTSFILFTFAGWGQTSRIIGSNQVEHANAIARSITPLNGYVMVGFTKMSPSNMNALIVLTRPDGTPVKSVIAGGEFDDEATSIARTSDNGYVVTGWTRSAHTKMVADIFVIKFDADLKALWSKIYHLTPNDLDHKAYSIIQVNNDLNGGYAVTGSAYSPNSSILRALVLRLDVNGNVSWVRTYGLGRNLSNEGFSITQVSDQNAPNVKFAVVGRTAPHATGFGDAFLIRLQSDGVINGNASIFNGKNEEYARSVVWDGTGSNPGIVTAGWTTSVGAGIPFSNIWVAKLQAKDGTATWSNVYYWKPLTGQIEQHDKVIGDKSLILTPAKTGFNYVLAGFSCSRGPNANTNLNSFANVLLMCLKPDGNLLWGNKGTIHPSAATNNKSDEAYGVVQSMAIPGLALPGDGFAVAGWSDSYNPANPLNSDNFLLTTFAKDGTRPLGCAVQYEMELTRFTGGIALFSTYTNAMTVKDFKVTECTTNCRPFCGKI